MLSKSLFTYLHTCSMAIKRRHTSDVHDTQDVNHDRRMERWHQQTSTARHTVKEEEENGDLDISAGSLE